MELKVAVVILTWQRIRDLKHTLRQLSVQSHKNFDVYISNSNTDPVQINIINKFLSYFDEVNATLLNDSNELYTFRRIFLGRDLAKSGYDVILYIDDDVTIDKDHVKDCLNQYEPQTYKSGHAWYFYKRGLSYYKYRKRVRDYATAVHYCGTGIAMLDASIFLENGLFNYPEGALKIEDLWLSYYAQHVMGWTLGPLKTGSVIGGSGREALSRQVRKDEINKDVFLKTLVDMGWDLPQLP